VGHAVGPVVGVVVDVALVGRTGATPVAELVAVAVELGLGGVEEDEEGRVSVAVAVAVVEGTTIVLTEVAVWTEVGEATELASV
jgi:hypothetical protein